MGQALDIVNLFGDIEVARKEGRLVLKEGTTVQGRLTQSGNEDIYQVSARFPVEVMPNGIDGLKILVDDDAIEILSEPAP